MKIHKAKKIHSCTMCDFISHSLSGLKKHLTMHQKTSSKSAVIVPKVEPLVESVENSENPSSQNSSSNGHTCPTCRVGFRSEFLYKRHKDKGCKGILRSQMGYHCPMCLHVSSRLRSVEDHLAGHTGEYRFRCPYCPYQCVRNNVLKDHISKRHPERI